jgi:hypothetical protein
MYITSTYVNIFVGLVVVGGEGLGEGKVHALGLSGAGSNLQASRASARK